MQMKNPPHPGEIIGDSLGELGVSISDTAKGLGISPAASQSDFRSQRHHGGNGCAAREGARQHRRHMVAHADELRPCANPRACTFDQGKAFCAKRGLEFCEFSGPLER